MGDTDPTPEAKSQTPAEQLQFNLRKLHEDWYPDAEEDDYPVEVLLGALTRGHPGDRFNEPWGRVTYTSSDSGDLTYCPPNAHSGRVSYYQFKFSFTGLQVSKVEEWLVADTWERAENSVSNSTKKDELFIKVATFLKSTDASFEISAGLLQGDEPELEPPKEKGVGIRKAVRFLFGILKSPIAPPRET